MAWNEPGNNQDKQNQDPWGDRKKKSKPKDLDDALNQLQQKFSKLIRKKQSGEGGSQNNTWNGASIIIAALIVIWLITGFFVVQAAEKAVVVRFGKYAGTIGSGLHWIPRFLDSETTVNCQKVHAYTYPSDHDALMLTQDQNIVAVAITVQYRIVDPQNFLFNVVNPVESMKQATASALRQVVGQMTIDAILTTGREQLRQNVKTQLEETLQRYQSGLEVTNVLLKSAQAPDAVKAAFDDAVKAQEDEKRYINQAQAYAMKVIPIAAGHAKRILSTAKAFQQRVELNAEANVTAYLALLPEYQKAPEVTRERLYFDTLQKVFENSSKILLDTNGANNLVYLPIDKLMGSMQKPSIQPAESMTQVPKITNPSSIRPTREQALDYGTIGDKP